MDYTQLEQLKKEFYEKQYTKDIGSEFWIELSKRFAIVVDQLIQEAISTNDPEVNEKAQEACNLALMSAQKIGFLHEIIPQLTLASGLINYQAHDYLKTGQLFYISYKLFKVFNKANLSKKAFEHSVNAYKRVINEYIIVTYRLIIDNERDIAVKYLISTLRIIISLEGLMTENSSVRNEFVNIMDQLNILLKAFLTKKDVLDKKALQSVELLQQFLELPHKKSEDVVRKIRKIRTKLETIIPSRAKLLLIIYRDGRTIFGYDFENKEQDYSKFVILSGVFFAIFQFSEIELKSGKINQIQNENGTIIVESRPPLIAFLLCEGEITKYAEKLSKLLDKIFLYHEQDFYEWKGHIFPLDKNIDFHKELQL